MSMQLSSSLIQEHLVASLKAKDTVATQVLRALKTRMQNEAITLGRDLEDADILKLVQSEVKRRKDAIEVYLNAGRQELADQEQAEIAVLAKFMPEQLSEDVLEEKIGTLIAEHAWTSDQFGVAMKTLKEVFGNTADSALVAKILKTKLK